jgi:MoaA/NifB/PqqE/SkfB family radical SAM enzyme
MNIYVSPEEVIAAARPEFFTPISCSQTARALFRHAVNQVEIEVFSYCNRTCWFCPNSKIDRRSKNNHMPEALYLRILRELAEIEYEGVVTYSRYNEPLSDRIILHRIQQAREILPKAHLMTYTNGDYLTRDYIDDLRAAGLNSLNVSPFPKRRP